MSRPVVFIHTNPQQIAGGKVAEYSLKRNSRHPDEFDVRYLISTNYPHLLKREGQQYRRKGKVVTWRNEDLQSFSLLRFLPPQEMGFRGRALVIDPDIFGVGDVWDLLSRDMGGKSVFACKKQLTPDRPFFWATSCMLLDCDRLKHWNWNQDIDDLFAQKFDYGEWINLLREPQESIGQLEDEWNQFDQLTEQTKLLHTTERSTQPWKTGLPVDFDLNHQSAEQYAERRSIKGLVKWVLGRGPKVERFKPHPEPRVEQFFFQMLGECLDKGIVTEKFLKEEMRQKHVRPDALQLIRTHQRKAA